MATDGSDEWHRIGDAVSPETTVRHSEPHRVELSSWARQHELSGIFDAVALTFGFTENFTIIGNLSRELSQPEADSLLTQWADNPYIAQLTRLRDAYFQSPEISFLYAGITHAGTADQTRAMLRRSGAIIAKQHFLLAMIINPLAQAPTATIYGLRRMLRVWLMVQALMRTVEQGCCRDQQIQVMASALTLDTLAPKWEVIDRILEHALRILGAPVFSYGQFTLALQRAAERLKPVYSGSSDRPTRQLLQALVTVAQGHCNPIRGHQEEPAAAMPAFTGIRPDADAGWMPRRPGEPPFALVSATPCGDTEEEDEEDPAQCLWVDVADAPTPGQQRLTGRSVLLQTAELAHYLPWSWDKPLPPELVALECWIEQTLATSSSADQLGAAVTWLAMTFARSLPFVLEFAITDTPQEEWSLTTDFTIAHLQSPRRHSSWQPDATHADCVEAFSERLAVTLPSAVSEVLQARSTAQTGTVASLHDLWFRTNRLSAQDWFRDQAQTHFPRVTGAMLANIQPQRIFARTADPALARLASSHPRSALPAACGYANWDIQQVEQGFGLRLAPDSRDPGGRINLLGSVLAPLESLLVDGVSQARRQLQALGDDPVAYHNALVRYSVMALYAATGCRHLSEPFESIQDFCTSPPAVFINDKSDDGLHAGRLVPLPKGALDLLAHYREHLACLQRAVEAQRPSLAQAIDRVLKGQSSHLPLFFLLDRSGRWHSLNDGSLPGAGTMPWPLPKNLFRHRYAQQLARQGVPSEVIEGWMGHAERGVASYGDHSPRCWLDDAHRYRDKIHDCFERLGFQVPAIAPKLSALALEPEGPGYSEPTLFGYAKRTLERQRARDRARASARRELDLYLGAHPYESLTQDYVDALAKRMLLRENGLPHPLAQVRFEVLVQWLEDGEPQDHRFIRRRLAQLEAERSRVRRQCPQALQLMPELRRWAQCTRKALRQTQVSKAAGLAVAVCFLVIEKRLTYARLLEDLIQGKHFRLIQHQRRVFVEYSEALTPDDFEQPVQRHEIDHTSARLLGRGLGIKTTVDLDSHPCPTVLASLVTLLSGFQATQGNASPSLGWLLRTLRRCVAQANLIELPGILAAALSERNPPTSTRLIDTLRITEGRYYPLPDAADPEPIPELADLPKVPTLRPSAAASARGHEAARTFFLELHHRLNGYRKSGALALAKDIDSYCKSQSTRVSSAVLLVGYWIAHRVRQGKGKHHQKHNPYAAGAIKRYLSALTQAFVGIASDTDLLRLDEDEVTDLCARMLTLKSQKEVDRQYFAARLREFFVWAGERGVSEPNWDDLDLGNAGRSVRPGLFSETEYHQCLSTLLQASTEASDRGLMAAFVLMLAYRFGLRAREAIGLRRRDWCQAGGLTWVLVRNNPFRTLKNAHNSRRAVPLMFDLSEDERTLIHTLLARYETLTGQTDNGPLLCALADHKVTLTPLERHLPSDIAIALKQVTGNERMTLHQARHAFCNRLAAALFDIDTPLTRALVGQQDAREIRTLLLGTPELPSRRCAMAIARAMGHQTPATSLRSYHHLLTEWADRLTPVDSHYVSRIAGAVQTDGWPTKAPSPGTGPSIFARPLELTPLRALQALRLFAMGYTAERAERLLRLAPGELTELERLANKVNARMRFKVLDPLSNTPHQVYGEDYPGLLLKSRPTVMWQRLLQWATDLPAMVPPEAPVTLPPLEEVPDLVGRNGHLLMNTPSHAHLLKSVIDAFRIPSTGYAAVVRGKPDSLSRATALLESVGFEVSTDARGQLDTFNADSREEFFRARSYAGLMVTKSATGPVCNGVELVLVFIAVAVCWCPRTATG